MQCGVPVLLTSWPQIPKDDYDDEFETRERLPLFGPLLTSDLIIAKLYHLGYLVWFIKSIDLINDNIMFTLYNNI